MKPKNRYLGRAKISEAKTREVAGLFSQDLTARQIADLSGLNRNTVNRLLTHIRTVLAAHCEAQSPFSGEVELDESYFGARRVRGVRGRGAKGKIIVFGILKRNGKVYTEIVPDVSRRTLQQIAGQRVSPDSTVYTDRFRVYDSLVDVGYKKHYRISHGDNEFVRGPSHINGIENFWGIAKVRLAKYRGMSNATFYLHLKETEFRYNYRDEDVYKKVLELLRKEAGS